MNTNYTFAILNHMEQIPLPAPIHYELILQLLERQTMSAVNQNPDLRHQVNQLIITLRKAAVQQKRLEQICEVASVPVDHRWSLNHHIAERVVAPD
jgi:Family of unknown function (DUF5340)